MGRGYGMIVAICSVMAALAECKYAPLDGLKSPAPYSQESAASFSHKRLAALATDAWGGMRVDWTVIAAFFAILVAIPALASLKTRKGGQAEYFRGANSMPWWLIGVSMVAATTSTNSANLFT